ncbi:hypothetical protein Goklo_002441, partial [Gossypium klotzschianum]|nr:hypothetical protein [Gossypium klotzschianum]
MLPVSRIEIERWRPPESAFIKIIFDGAFQVVRLGIDLGFQDVVIEGDSLTVIKK